MSGHRCIQTFHMLRTVLRHLSKTHIRGHASVAAALNKSRPMQRAETFAPAQEHGAGGSRRVVGVACPMVACRTWKTILFCAFPASTCIRIIPLCITNNHMHMINSNTSSITITYYDYQSKYYHYSLLVLVSCRSWKTCLFCWFCLKDVNAIIERRTYFLSCAWKT